MQMSAPGSLQEDCEEMLRSILVRISLCTLGQHRMNSKIACLGLCTVIKFCGTLPLTTTFGRQRLDLERSWWVTALPSCESMQPCSALLQSLCCAFQKPMKRAQLGQHEIMSYLQSRNCWGCANSAVVFWKLFVPSPVWCLCPRQPHLSPHCKHANHRKVLRVRLFQWNVLGKLSASDLHPEMQLATKSLPSTSVKLSRMKGTLYKQAQPIISGKFWNMKSFVVAKIVPAGAAVFWNLLYHHRFLCAQDNLTFYHIAHKQICRQLYKKVIRVRLFRWRLLGKLSASDVRAEMQLGKTSLLSSIFATWALISAKASTKPIHQCLAASLCQLPLLQSTKVAGPCFLRQRCAFLQDTELIWESTCFKSYIQCQGDFLMSHVAKLLDSTRTNL